LISRGIQVNAFDPAGMENARLALGESVQFTASAEECIHLSQLIVVATPWKEFIDIPAEKWGGAGAEKTIVDCWRVLKLNDKTAGVRYIGLGSSPERTMSALE
jgi:UDP-glucose 6-dehydrogenase